MPATPPPTSGPTASVELIIVIDASVAAKWFLPEPLSDVAAEILASDHALLAPDLIRLEVASALLKAVRRGVLAAGDADAALARLTPPALRLEPAADYAEEALRLAGRHGGTVYDGVYIALSLALDAVVATNDVALARTARAAGATAWHLSEPPPHGLRD